MKRRVPLIKQHEAKDCGAACLSMILEYYGKKIPFAAVSEAIKVDRQGANLYGLHDGASQFDLDATILEGSAQDFIQEVRSGQIKLPSIVRIVNRFAMEHYIVVTKIKGNKVASYFTRAGRILNAEWLARSGQEIYAELAKQDAILKPHIKALSVAQKRVDVNCSDLAEKYEQIGLAHISLDGHGKKALDNCLEALRLRENDQETTNEQLAWSLFYVGLAYQRHHGEQGRWGDISDSLMLAEDYHRRALAIWNELPPLRVNSYNIAQDKTNGGFETAYSQMLSDYGYRWFPGDFAQDDKILYWLQIEASLENVTAMLSLARRYRDGITYLLILMMWMLLQTDLIV